MALAFRKVKRTLSVGQDKGKQMFFTMAKKTSETNFSEVCELVSHNSSMSSADVKSILDSLNWVITRELKAGRSVQVGELGNFRLTLCAKAQEKAEDATANNVSKARVKFWPGAALRNMLAHMSFIPYEEILVEKVVEKDCDREHLPG